LWQRSSGCARGPPRDDSSEVVTVSPRTFTATVVALGAVKPQIGAEVRIGSRISGRVGRLSANIGDRVDKGQIIAELETSELDALINQRRAELRLAEAKHAAFDTLAPEEEAGAQADVTRFEAEAMLAAEDRDRQQTLLERRRAPRLTLPTNAIWWQRPSSNRLAARSKWCAPGMRSDASRPRLRSSERGLLSTALSSTGPLRCFVRPSRASRPASARRRL